MKARTSGRRSPSRRSSRRSPTRRRRRGRRRDWTWSTEPWHAIRDRHAADYDWHNPEVYAAVIGVFNALSGEEAVCKSILNEEFYPGALERIIEVIPRSFATIEEGATFVTRVCEKGAYGDAALDVEESMRRRVDLVEKLKAIAGCLAAPETGRMHRRTGRHPGARGCARHAPVARVPPVHRRSAGSSRRGVSHRADPAGEPDAHVEAEDDQERGQRAAGRRVQGAAPAHDASRAVAAGRSEHGRAVGARGAQVCPRHRRAHAPRRRPGNASGGVRGWGGHR